MKHCTCGLAEDGEHSITHHPCCAVFDTVDEDPPVDEADEYYHSNNHAGAMYGCLAMAIFVLACWAAICVLLYHAVRNPLK